MLANNVEPGKNPGALDFIRDDTETGRLARSIDWSGTPLGAPETWSPSLRMMVPFVFASRFPQLLWWGPDYVCIYNDAYAPVLGAKHPRAMGQPMREVWSEVWDLLKPLIDTPFNGGPATWMEDLDLEVQRHGFVEEAHFTVAYSPAPDESAPRGIGGVMATVVEITEKVIGERRLRILKDLGTQVSEADTDAGVCRAAAAVLGQHPKDAPFAMLYLLDETGKRLDLVARTGIDAGNAGPASYDVHTELAAARWPLAEVLRTERMQVREHIEGLPPVTLGPSSNPPRTVVVVPIRSNLASRPAGAIVFGVSPRLRFDQYYAGFFELAGAQIATAIANKRAYEEERRRAAALAELDRAKTAFFSNVSHEFRTPLTLMLGPLEDSLADDTLPQRLRAALEVSHRNSLRLLKLVNSLLDFARIEAGRVQASYEAVDLAALTQDLASNFRSAIERAGLTFSVDCDALPEPVHVDREMWEKIVLNLLSNAFKFTLEGGIHVRLTHEGGTAQLVVEDTGVGVPEHELPRLFERFHRVEGVAARTHEGSGIGLALVQELVKLHGGAIEASSEFGRGTEFRVRIPYGSAHLAPSQVSTKAAPARTGGHAQAFVQEALRWLPDEFGDGPRELADPLLAPASRDRRFAAIHGARVILADDNADMRAYVRELLGGFYGVETVADGEAALAAARQRRPDLILTDVMMPRLDGFGLLRAIRADESLREVPVVLLSARAGEEARIEGLNAGADDYIVKPFSARELLARVDSLLELVRTRRDSEERFRAYVQATSDVVYRMNADWSVLQNLEGRNFIADQTNPSQNWVEKYIPEAERPRIWTAIRAAIADKQPFELEHRVLREGKDPGWVFSRAIPLLDKNGEIVEWFGAASDVTERRATQEALLRQRLELERAGRQKDEFLAMLAHELRNPLAPIRNSSELLLRRLEPDAPARGAVHTIERQVTHLTRIVDDLLDISRITQGRIELRRRPVAVADLVARALETVEPLIRHKGHVVTRAAVGRPLHVNVDPERIVQCLGNLLTNAAKYTEPGGAIRIDTREIDGQASIAIADNGVGIAAELLPKVFDLFVQGERTLDRAQGGLGIGLSLVKKLVGMHEGSVHIDSAGALRGTTCEIRLPLHEGAAASARPAPAAASRAHRILVVDDNEDAANTLAMILEMDGHEIATAHSGLEALDRVEAFRPGVVLLDIGLPGLDGYQIAQRIRREPRFEGIRLVALTGYGTSTDRQRAHEAGFTHHLVKPVDFADLKRTLDSLH